MPKPRRSLGAAPVEKRAARPAGPRLLVLLGAVAVGLVVAAALLQRERSRAPEADRPVPSAPAATPPERPADQPAAVVPPTAEGQTATGPSAVGEQPEPAAEPPVPAERAVPRLPPIPLAAAPPARPYDIVRDVYTFAAAHPEVLAYVPCYCGCEANGHRSNLDCFVAGRDGEGRVSRWNAHGLG